MKRILWPACFLLLLIQSAYSQSIDKTKLDSYFQTLEANNKFMGSVAIAQGGKILYTKAIGFRFVEDKLKPNEHTKYRIGSISKTFTAALLFKAIDEKKTELTQTLNKYFPTVKNSDKITLGHLLSHRSGIHNFTDDPNYSQWHTQKRSEVEMVNMISSLGSDFDPGSKAAYSNSNYVLLTYVLQKLYNKPYNEILQNKIVNPIGLKDTYYGGAISIGNNESYSYKFNSGWKKQEETDMSIPAGAGAIVSTPTDLTVFAQALFNGKIVSAESLKQMKTIQDGYGMGLFESPFQEKKSYGHNGGIDGFTSNFGYFPEDKVAIAFTSNGSAYDNNKISLALLSSVFNKPYDLPVFVTVTTGDLDQYLGIYSAKNFPLKITITKSDNTLIGQATGQPSFKLDATAKHVFNFDQAGLALHFNPDTKEMTLKQGGREFLLIKE
jgi:D-alanyl-D-alanine carboxypeptidase